MSEIPSNASIARGETPPRMSGATGYLKAREHLRRDFAHRCAYCLTHENRAGGPEQFCIDHFQPRGNGGLLTEYGNLYWCCMGCDRFKSDYWPTAIEAARGYRYADPCRERDYGAHFVEDEAGSLVALTNCGTYHVARLRLNRPSRLLARRERMEIDQRLTTARQLMVRIELRGPSVYEQQAIRQVSELITTLETQVTTAIPALTGAI